MAQVLLEPSFEDSTPWTYYAPAQQTDLLVHTGTYAAQLPRLALFVSPGRVRQTYVWQAGKRYDVWAYVNGDYGGASTIRCQIDDGSGVTLTLGETPFIAPGWHQWNVGTFVAIGGAGWIEWRINTTTNGLYWYIDDVEVNEEGEAMAVMLSELAVHAMLAQLQSSLSAELAFIDSERGGALGLAVPTDWYCWKRDVASLDEVECEVYEEGSLDFPRMDRDLSLWMTGARVAVASAVRIVVAINHANRDGLKPSEMKSRTWRYGAGVLRVVRNNPQLGQGAVMMTWPESIRYSEIAAGGPDTMRRADRVEVVFRVDMYETSTGETVAGGGVPPSATLEG